MGEYSDELDRYLQEYEEKIGKTLRVPEQLIQRKLINQSIESGRFSNPRKLFEGSLNPSHLILEINVGKSRIRHRTTFKLNDFLLILS